MTGHQPVPGRRERARADKHRRILSAAQALFTARGVDAVTTQEVADRADVAIGTLFLYASSKAELLLMVQNEKFEAAVVAGVHAADEAGEAGASEADTVLALLDPVVKCIRERPENGRAYLNELAFGDPGEVQRDIGLALARRLEVGIIDVLTAAGRPQRDAVIAARIVSSVLQVSTTATEHRLDDLASVRLHVRAQIEVLLGTVQRPHVSEDVSVV